MKDLKYDELTEAQKADVTEKIISLLQRERITLETKMEIEHHLYVEADGEIHGFRVACMFSSGEAMKWGERLSLLNALPMDSFDDEEPVAKPAAKPATVAGEPTVGWVEYEDIIPSPHNPRKSFDAERLSELNESLISKGLTPALSHLLVRPHPSFADKYELVCGERRWRAAGNMNEDFWERQKRMSGTDMMFPVPAVVLPMTDSQALEMMLIENLQRADITVLEEAQSYKSMLEMKREAGEPYTIESLATRLGRSPRTIRERLSLCGLAGSPVGAALNAGQLPVSHAVVMSRLPANVQPEILARTLQPDGGVLPVRELRRIVKDEVMIEIRSAHFDPEDAELVPAAGACPPCPNYTHSGADERDSGGPRMCMNPECYARKRHAQHERWMQQSASIPNMVAMGLEDGLRLFDPNNGKRLAYNSGYVELDEKPQDFEVTDAAPDPMPTWKSLVKGSGVAVYLAKDATGEVHHLLNRQAAIAAAEANGWTFFRGSKAAKTEPAPEHAPVPAGETVQTIEKKRETEEEKAARLREQARQIEAEKRIELAVLRGIFHKVCADKRPGMDLFALLAEPVTKLGPVMQESFFLPAAIALGYDEKECGRSPDAVATWLMAHVKSLPHEHGLAAMLLIVSGVTFEEERGDWLKRVTKLLGFSRKDVEKKIAAEMADEDKREAERLEIENGLVFSDHRNKPEDFKWDGANVCEWPTIVSFTMPEKTKVLVSVALGKSDKGWHAGWELSVNGKLKLKHPCQRTETSYTERKLATVQSLYALMEKIDASQKWALEVMARLTTYSEKLEAPPDKPERKSKKKGGK